MIRAVTFDFWETLVSEGAGIDAEEDGTMPTRQELVGSDLTVDEIRAFLGADSLGYLSLDALVRAAGSPNDDFCRACFDGEYPVPIPERAGKFVLEQQLQLPTA